MNDRRLIINADDFGLSPGINRGVVECFEKGILRSASLMVRAPAANEAAEHARGRPGLSVGLHLDLWEYQWTGDAWRVVYEVVDPSDSEAVSAEIARQVSAFVKLMGAAPTHIDSHQHAHKDEPIRSLVQTLADRLGVPLRGGHPSIRYCGDFYGQSGKGYPVPEAIMPETLERLIVNLPAGVTEVGCHPGYADDIDSIYRNERSVEVATLCDLRIRRTIELSNVRLCSFNDYQE